VSQVRSCGRRSRSSTKAVGETRATPGASDWFKGNIYGWKLWKMAEHRAFLSIFGCRVLETSQLEWCSPTELLFFLHLGWNHPYFAVTWQTQLLGRYMKVCNRQQTTQEKGLSVTTWAYLGLLYSDTTVANLHGCFPCPPLTTRSAGLISALWNPASSF